MHKSRQAVSSALALLLLSGALAVVGSLLLVFGCYSGIVNLGSQPSE